MTDQIAYQEYIQRRYNAFCKTVIRCAAFASIFPLSYPGKKELVYGYVITGYKLIKDLQAWLLPFVFNIRKVARGNVHFVAYFLAAFISACPRCFYGLPESCKVIQRYWSFCHNNSPNYILLFLSLLGYAYTVPTISQNNSYYCRIKTY